MRFICHRLRAAIFSHLAPLNGLALEAHQEMETFQSVTSSPASVHRTIVHSAGPLKSQQVFEFSSASWRILRGLRLGGL